VAGPLTDTVAREPADRGPMYPDALAQVNAYIQRFADAVDAQLPPLDERGQTAIRHGALIIGINASIEHGVLLLLVKMAPLGSRPAAFYRELLELNFLSTGDCTFAIDAQSDTLYLKAMRSLAGLDYTEFRDLLQTIASVASRMSRRVDVEPA
jgi:hypothetical protein